MVKISELPELTAVTGTDVVVVNDASDANATKRATVDALAAAAAGGGGGAADAAAEFMPFQTSATGYGVGALAFVNYGANMDSRLYFAKRAPTGVAGQIPAAANYLGEWGVSQGTQVAPMTAHVRVQGGGQLFVSTTPREAGVLALPTQNATGQTVIAVLGNNTAEMTANMSVASDRITFTAEQTADGWSIPPSGEPQTIRVWLGAATAGFRFTYPAGDTTNWKEL